RGRCRRPDGHRAGGSDDDAREGAAQCVDLVAARAATSALNSPSLSAYELIHENPISSTDRLPNPAGFRGSGLYLLAVVLSYQLMTCSIVYAGTSGATSSA